MKTRVSAAGRPRRGSPTKATLKPPPGALLTRRNANKARRRVSTQQPREACKVDSCLIFQKNKTERDNGELSYCIYLHDPSGHAGQLSPEGLAPAASPGRASTRDGLTCSLRRRRPGGPDFRVQFPPHAEMLSAPPRALPPLPATRGRSRRTLRPSSARAAFSAGEPSAAPGRDSPPPGFHAARVSKGSSAARGTLHVVARSASPPLSGAPPGRRGAAATRRREGRWPGCPGLEPAGSSALVSQASSLPPEGQKKARTPRRPTP